MSAYHYYQQVGGEETWQPFPVSQLEAIETKEPMFITVLSVSKLTEDLTYEDKLKLAYSGPAYFDWDSPDAELVIEKVNQFLDRLEELNVDLSMCYLYATGKKGYHLEIPPQLFMEKVPAKGVVGLPHIYREMALALCVDTLDLKIYSSGRGRMWRQPNVKRENGRYKVRISVPEMRSMTPEKYDDLTSAPRKNDLATYPQFCTGLSIVYSRAVQKVEDLLAKRRKFKPDPHVKQKASGWTIQCMMEGLGFREGVGFQQIATQLAIAATTAGMQEDAFIAACEGLITSHQSDGSRYNSESKRREELRRMFRYMEGNVCYEFSVGAIKSLLCHGAPDLDGMPASEDDVRANIKEAEQQQAQDEQQIDEYADVAKGVTLEKFGVYADSLEHGKKRICAMSFANPAILRSAETNQIIGYEADITVNGVMAGRNKLELDVFASLTNFNRWASKYGHALQGNDAQVRTVMMRFVEQAKKKGRTQYTVNREGLDLISIPLHENEALREPFLIWADHQGVTVEPRVRDTGIEIIFHGFPDPRGVYRTDLSAAPALADWIEQKGNRALLTDMLTNLMTCQKAEVLGKLLGWYTACFYKQLFQTHYKKFPLLHVNGPAGLGKTELNLGLGQLFFWNGSIRPLSPSSTPFAINQHLTASSSIPMIFDEYKPHEMSKIMHDKLKGMLRDAYNQRDVARGGGNRESDDYRQLQFTQMAAPLVFIAEAAEEEAAVMERVVLVTLARPPQAVGIKNYTRFQAFQRNQHLMGVLGQYLASDVINGAEGAGMDHDQFRAEFDEMYEEARNKFMLTEADLTRNLSEEELKQKQSSKERSVYNHTVARFGFQKFRQLVNDALESRELDAIMAELEDSIYARMSDLHAATTPEYVKVLQQIAEMSYLEDTRQDAIRKDSEYAFGTGDTVELAVRTAYMRYRTYMRTGGMSPLFQGYEAFAHALRDSPAYVKTSMGESLKLPGVMIFRSGELAKLGVAPFKD